MDTKRIYSMGHDKYNLKYNSERHGEKVCCMRTRAKREGVGKGESDDR